MMDDNELRRRFARLREVDQERAPTFAQTYGHARARTRRPSRLRMRTLVVSAAAAVVLAAVWLGRARPVSSELAPTIATWHAPSDVLLRIPGSELLGTMPELGASVLDTMIPIPSKEGA